MMAVALFATVLSAGAQTKYNYFDPADCDSNGWLWFDNEAKLEKYCGFNTETKNYKIQLQTATFMDANDEFPEPTLDSTIKGWNIDGVQGGEGSWTGAVVLCGGSSSLGTIPASGGGIFFQLPDCAEFSLALSTELSQIMTGTYASKKSMDIVDLGVIQTSVNMGFIKNPIAKVNQYKWLNIQNVTNEDNGEKILAPKGTKVAVLFRNNQKVPLLVQGIKLFTYTDTNPDAAVGEITTDNNAPVEYYNLQGVRVSGDQPGVYVRRQGSSVSKVIIK